MGQQFICGPPTGLTLAGLNFQTGEEQRKRSMKSKILNCTEEDCPSFFEDLPNCGESHLATCMDCFRKVQLVGSKEMAEAMILEDMKVALGELVNG